MNETKFGGRAFYTSLAHPDDFALEGINSLLKKYVSMLEQKVQINLRLIKFLKQMLLEQFKKQYPDVNICFALNDNTFDIFFG